MENSWDWGNEEEEVDGVAVKKRVYARWKSEKWRVVKMTVEW